MPHGQATKRRLMNSVSEATPTKVPAHLSTSPSLQTTGIYSSVKRVRGPTRGKKTSRLITQHGGKKFFVGVSSERRTFVGLNATKAANELGAQIRLQAPLQGTENWEDVPPAIRATIVQSVQDKFEIEGYNESPLTQEVTDTKAIHLYKGWRYHMNQHYKTLGKAGTDPYSNPCVGVSQIDWRYMIDHVFLGDTHKGIENGKEPHIVDFYKTLYWSKKRMIGLNQFVGCYIIPLVRILLGCYFQDNRVHLEECGTPKSLILWLACLEEKD